MSKLGKGRGYGGRRPPSLLFESQCVYGIRLSIYMMVDTYLLGMPFWLPVAWFLSSGSVLYWVHRLAHEIHGHLWHEIHVSGHHIKCYPAKRFRNLIYLVNPLDPTGVVGTLVYVIPALSILVLWLTMLELEVLQTGFLLLQLVIGLCYEEYAHRQMHATSSWMHQFDTFRFLRAMHFKHHQGHMKCNYGVTVLVFDMMFGTLLGACSPQTPC